MNKGPIETIDTHGAMFTFAKRMKEKLDNMKQIRKDHIYYHDRIDGYFN